jgi:hypothetical protein
MDPFGPGASQAKQPPAAEVGGCLPKDGHWTSAEIYETNAIFWRRRNWHRPADYCHDTEQRGVPVSASGPLRRSRVAVPA